MKRPLIAALGVCHRDIELACLWLRWVAFLSKQPGGNMMEEWLLVVLTKSVTSEQLAALADCVIRSPGCPSVHFRRCPDEDEAGYPRSASHLFLRTLEIAEDFHRGHAVLWCEADTVPMRPTWFAEISAEYDACGKPFLGARVGKHHPQMSGIGVYPHDWRKIAPKIADVLNAPDISQFGKGKGCAWDVWCADQIVPNMTEAKTIFTQWKNRAARPTKLADVPDRAAIYHQEKTPALVLELAAARYPEFVQQIAPTAPRYFMMNGHESRLRANGFVFKADKKRFGPGGWTAVFTTANRTPSESAILGGLVGIYGVKEITKEVYDDIQGA